MRALLLSAFAMLAACAQPQTGTVLTFGSPYSPNHPFSQADREWMAWVEKESGGRIRIKPYWAGGLLSSDESMLELRHGVVDVGLVTPIYARGGAHVLRAQAGFYGGVADYSGQLAVYRCLNGGFPDFAHELDGLKVLAVQGGNLPGVVTRARPIRSLGDFRGLRLRAPVELTGLLVALGADPVSMPMGEVYSSLAKGVIDGVVAPEDTLQSLHFNEVAAHFSQVRFARGAYASRAMSARKFASLSAEDRDVLERSIPVWEAALQKFITKANASGYAYGVKEGMDFVTFDPVQQAELDKLYNDQALAAAKATKGVGGGDIEPMFRAAQAAAGELNAGRQPACAGGAS